MSKWESKLFETGNAKDASRLERPVKRRESCESLQQSITRKKDIASKQRYHSKDKLKAAVTAAFQALTSTMLKKFLIEHGIAYYAPRIKDSIQMYWMHEL